MEHIIDYYWFSKRSAKKHTEKSKIGPLVLPQSEITHLDRVLIVSKKGKTEEVIYKVLGAKLNQFKTGVVGRKIGWDCAEFTT